MEIRNAKIAETFLGFEGHGILSWMLYMDYGSGLTQGFGGYSLAREHIEKILKVVKKEKWEDVKGAVIRVKIENGIIVAIGHFLEDKWFNPKE